MTLFSASLLPSSPSSSSFFCLWVSSRLQFSLIKKEKKTTKILLEEEEVKSECESGTIQV